jgi:uncharacterized protein YuzE
MRLEYDREADAAYVRLLPAGTTAAVARTVPLDPSEVDGEINLDFDPEGRLVGVEIQDASRFLDARLLEQSADK